MDENKETINSEKENEKLKHECLKKECWKKCLAMTLAAFLGGFLAVYCVTDMMYKQRELNHRRHHAVFDEFQRRDFEAPFGTPEEIAGDIMLMKKQQEKMVRELERSPWDMKPFFASPVGIITDFNNDKFVVKVNLKHLNDDAKNIKYQINGRKLTIKGDSKVKDKDYENQISFSQDLILPEKAKIDELKTEEANNHWILTIPVEK